MAHINDDETGIEDMGAEEWEAIVQKMDGEHDPTPETIEYAQRGGQ